MVEPQITAVLPNGTGFNGTPSGYRKRSAQILQEMDAEVEKGRAAELERWNRVKERIIFIVPTPKAIYALEAAERRRYEALPWWRRALEYWAHRRDPMNLEQRT